MVLLRLTAFANGVDCTAPLERTTLVERMAEVDVAFAAIDWPALSSRVAAIHSALPCARFRLRSDELARFYRFRGWTLLYDGSDQADAWLAAAYVLQPNHVFDPELGGPMAAAWVRARHLTLQRNSFILKPTDGELFVDGRGVAEVHRGLPWTLQHVGDDGAVVASWVVEPGASVPEYAARSVSVAGVREEATGNLKPEREPRQGPGRPARAFAVAGAGAVVVGALSLAGAARTKGVYKRDPTKPLYSQNLALGITGWSLVGVGGGLGALAAANGKW